MAEAAAAEVVLGPKRTPTQDVEFSIGALVEIALRALSPGINDPRTAITCIAAAPSVIRSTNAPSAPTATSALSAIAWITSSTVLAARLSRRMRLWSGACGRR